MNMHQFVVHLESPPAADQSAQLLNRATDLAVEVGARGRWAAAVVDRPAPTVAEAIVSALADLDSVPMAPLAVGADDQLVPLWVIAERVACPIEGTAKWVSGESGPGGFPEVAAVLGDREYYRWSEVCQWLYERMGLAVPDPHPAYVAVNLALRLRRIAPTVEGSDAVIAITRPEAGPR